MTGREEGKNQRVLVVENHAFFRENLVEWITHQPGLTCCGEATSAAEAEAALDSTQPDLILLDLTLEGSTGFDFLRLLEARQSRVPVIVLSQNEEQRSADAALAAGARGYVSKAAATEELRPAIDAVVAGSRFVSGRGVVAS
jgi:DNA-binding NarL/FixJ family response regulator